ncbi:hypothetical protein ACROYT_G005168 [Oculina patagonica]
MRRSHIAIVNLQADLAIYAWWKSPMEVICGSDVGTYEAMGALGVHGFLNASQYWNKVKGGKGSEIKTSKLCSLAMKWGTVCEDSAKVSYLSYLNSTAPKALLSETGTWHISKNETEFLAASSDDIVNMNGSGFKHLTG